MGKPAWSDKQRQLRRQAAHAAALAGCKMLPHMPACKVMLRLCLSAQSNAGAVACAWTQNVPALPILKPSGALREVTTTPANNCSPVCYQKSFNHCSHVQTESRSLIHRASVLGNVTKVERFSKLVNHKSADLVFQPYSNHVGGIWACAVVCVFCVLDTGVQQKSGAKARSTVL
eukprot:scaffold242322_cov21-Tisochrysis_lutea.AAC.1